MKRESFCKGCKSSCVLFQYDIPNIYLEEEEENLEKPRKTGGVTRYHFRSARPSCGPIDNMYQNLKWPVTSPHFQENLHMPVIRVSESNIT
jgi:hypothetical protein